VVFAGAVDCAAIVPLGALVPVLEPSALLAITDTRSVFPASPLFGWYVCAVAPVMSWQAFPCSSQMRHWYWNVIGADPLHVPGFAVSVLPTADVPLIDGAELIDGATAARDATAAAVPTATSAATIATISARRCERRFILS
jgi:hypothetical protein